MKCLKIFSGVCFFGSLLSGCGETPSGGPSARLEVEFVKASQEVQQSLHQSLEDLIFKPFSVPSTISGFTCLGVNVVGEGIPSKDGDKGGFDMGALISGASYCTYPGIGGMIPGGSGGIVSVQVPTGKSRVVQIIANTSADGICREDPTTGVNESYYEVGRSVVDIFQNTTLAISGNYNDLTFEEKTKRKVNCGGGGYSCQNPGMHVSFETTTTAMSLAVGYKLAQEFKVSSQLYLSGIDLYLTLTAASSLSVYLAPDSGGAPSASGWISLGSISSASAASPAWYFFSSPGNIYLTSGSYYWVIIDSGVGAPSWSGSSTDDYSDGVAKQNSGGSWSIPSPVVDFSFRVRGCTQ